MKSMIEDGLVHIFDGAMGSVLYTRGVFVNICFDELNLSNPEIVRRIHQEYVSAGSEIIETNTFGANPVKLSSHGLGDRTEEINEKAAHLARDAGAGRVAVVGAIGPLGIRIEPWGPTACAEATAFFERQVNGLLAGGVDGFILETFADLNEIDCAFTAIRKLGDLPVIAQMTLGQNGKTVYGHTASQIAQELTSIGVDVIGLNCSVGPAVMLDAIEDMADTTSIPLSAQPNAGLPRTVRDRKIYMATPEYMAQYARRMVDAGVRFVGGCCGTTPDHIKQIRDSVRSDQPRPVTVRVTDVVDQGRLVTLDPVPLEACSAWGRKLSRGEPVVSVEVLPPRGWDRNAIVEPAHELKDAGVDSLAIVDSPRSRSRMGALSAAVIVEQEVGIEAIVHYTCRDRNMLGMISDLLGAAAVGIRNLLVVSGDPSVHGPYPDMTEVFDIDSIGLTNVVTGLNQGIDPAGNSIGDPTKFVQGVVANPGALDLEREVTRFRYKVGAGASFVVTQPIFDPESLERFLDKIHQWKIPVVAGIWPFLNLRNAEFLANEVPGATVPEQIIDRMRKAQTYGDEEALNEGVEIAVEMIDTIRPLVQGFHLSAPSRRVNVALRVLEEAGVSTNA
jgi:homocysteine S-methyltransferase